MTASLDLRVRLRALDEMSRTFRSVGLANNRLMRAFDSNRNSLHQLNTQMRNIAAYRQQRQAVSQNSQALVQMRERVRVLHQQLRNGNAVGRSAAQMRQLREQYNRARQSVSQLEQVRGREQQRLARLTQQLRQAGIDTNRLAEAEARLTRNAQRLNGELDRQSRRLERNAEAQRRRQRAAAMRDRMAALGGNFSMTGAVSMGAASRIGHWMAGMFMPGIDFDAQIARVAAVSRTQKGSAEYNKLRDQAKMLGATTMFTATQAGAGQEFLARAGYSSKAILNSMPEMLALAQAAGMEDLGQVADIASNIGGAFRVNPEDAKQVQHLADVLTNTTASANVDLTMLGDTMKYLAQAGDLNLTIEQASAMAGVLGNVGIQGTQAGTALRAMLVRSVGPAKAARKAMKSIGISFTDTGDQVKNFEQILTQLNQKTKHMGNAKRAAIIKAIFGTEAVSAITELLNQEKTGLLFDLIRANEKSEGINRRMAQEMSDTAKGDLLSLQSAWEGLQIDLFEGNNSPLREFLQSVTEWIRSSAQWIKQNPELTRTIIKVAAAFVLLAGAGGLLMMTLAPIITGLGMIYFIGSGAGNLIALLVSPVRLLAGAFLALGRAVLANPIILAITLIIGAIWALYQNWDKVVTWAKGRGEALKNWWRNFSFIEAVKGAFWGLGGFFRDVGGIIMDSVRNTTHNVREAYREMGITGAVHEAFQGAIDFLLTLGGYLFSILVDAGREVVVAILGWDVYNSLVNMFSEAIETVMGVINKLIAKIKEAGQALMNFLGLGSEGNIMEKYESAEAKKLAGMSKSAQLKYKIDQNNEQIRAADRAAKNAERDKQLREYRKSQGLPTKLPWEQSSVAPVTRNNLSANSNTTVNINVSGGGDNKALAAQIGKEVRGALASERRRQGGSRSAFYDTDAALA